MTLLKFEHISKTYQTGEVVFKALDDVNLEIKEGEIVAIMGPSGSGKSTLMHIAGCLDTPTSGKIFLENEDVSKLSEAQLAKVRNKKVGFVFQTFNLIPRTTTLDNVALPLLYQGVSASQRKEKAMAILEKVNLKERANYFPNQLSGGQQQRVAIARALITSPSIILADEPTGNLDSKSGKEIMAILQRLNKEGHTIILVTHDREVAKCAKRIIRIRDGRII